MAKVSIVKGFDFTLKCDNENQERSQRNDLICILKETTTKYVFQLEKSESGYLHYQGRMRLIKKTTIKNLKNLFCKCPAIHFSPTVSSNYKQESFNYVMKAETRVKGPWSDQDKEEVPMPVQYELSDWYPWQRQALELIAKDEIDRNFRNVYCIVDICGNSGKTTFGMNLTVKGQAEYLPPFNDAKDLIRMCYCLPTSKLYIIDLTKSMNKDKLIGLYSGIEQLKNGYLYDERHVFKRRFINAPGVIVMTNEPPNRTYLSLDRWKVKQINEKRELEEYVYPEDECTAFVEKGKHCESPDYDSDEYSSD